MGAIVGKLRINGNPSVDNGDIKLSLRERDSPVQIAVGSKDLVLKTALDKEGLHGPASVYVNVICDRRHSTDPVSTYRLQSNNYQMQQSFSIWAVSVME